MDKILHCSYRFPVLPLHPRETRARRLSYATAVTASTMATITAISTFSSASSSAIIAASASLDSTVFGVTDLNNPSASISTVSWSTRLLKRSSPYHSSYASFISQTLFSLFTAQGRVLHVAIFLLGFFIVSLFHVILLYLYILYWVCCKKYFYLLFFSHITTFSPLYLRPLSNKNLLWTKQTHLLCGSSYLINMRKGW